MKISIIGGGRWARTIASVLCSLPRREDRVILHAKHDAPGVAAWIKGFHLGDRLRTIPVWPDFGSKADRPDAVIVANRAGDHLAAALPALHAGVPTLIEKPVALPSSRIAGLIRSAEDNAAFLAASNVFLFARYFEAFAQHVATLGRPHHLNFVWTDGAGDIRRGTRKSYDAGMTLFDDVLPHIVPMLANLALNALSLETVSVSQGGADITIEARSKGCPATLNLARDADRRQRLIEIETDGGTATLEFSDEPGFIHAPGVARNGDPLWDSAPHPLAAMLTAFLAAVEGQPLDARLSPARAMTAATFADAVRGRYIAHQVQWLEHRLGEALDAPLRYALKELAGHYGASLDDTIAGLWAAMDTPSRLKSFLSQCRLLSETDYAP